MWREALLTVLSYKFIFTLHTSKTITIFKLVLTYVVSKLSTWLVMKINRSTCERKVMFLEDQEVKNIGIGGFSPKTE